MIVTILSARTTTNSAPSGATAGVQIRKTSSSTAGRGLSAAQRALILIKSTAGSGTMTATVKLWGYISAGSGDAANPAAGWYPLGTSSTAANKGIVNEQSAMGETTADGIAHAEVLENIAPFDRLYAEVTAIGGTSTAISVFLAGLPEVRS
jgi:hypothetical protein